MTAQDRCVSFVREFGVPDARARELCRDRELQRCAAFWRPQTSSEVNFENLAACYGETKTPERST